MKTSVRISKLLSDKENYLKLISEIDSEIFLIKKDKIFDDLGIEKMEIPKICISEENDIFHYGKLDYYNEILGSDNFQNEINKFYFVLFEGSNYREYRIFPYIFKNIEGNTYKLYSKNHYQFSDLYDISPKNINFYVQVISDALSQMKEDGLNDSFIADVKKYIFDFIDINQIENSIKKYQENLLKLKKLFE